MVREHLHNLWLRLKALMNRRQLDEDLAEELDFHLAMREENLIKQGMSPADAHDAARRGFGNVVSLKESSRNLWSFPSLESLGQDLRYGLRQLRRSPGFTSVAMTTLALGIAATAVLFSILDGAYIHFPGPRNGSSVVVLTQNFTKHHSETWLFSPAEYFDIASLRRSFDGFFAVSHSDPTLTDTTTQGGNPERVSAVHATANMFSLYAIRPLLGRVFTADEDRPGGLNIAVVTYRLWNRLFARDRSIVGKTIELDGFPYTVIGVMPRGFQQWGADIYVPLDLSPASTNRSERSLTVAGVVKPGLSAEQTEPALRDLARRVEAQYGAANPEYGGLVYIPYDVRKGVVGDLRVALYVLLGAVALLLLITAANIANLMMARTRARTREIGTRLALGATPARLARQFLTESLLLSSMAGLVGLLLGFLALKPVMALIPERFIGEGVQVHTSLAALLVGVAVTLILGVVFGMAPAFFISRRGVAGNLGQTRTAAGGDYRSGRARALLVLSEMALAFIVVTGAGLMFRSYRQPTSMSLGFQPDHVLTIRIALPEAKYGGGTQAFDFFRELLRRVRSLPGVVNVAASSVRPMEYYATRDFSIPGRPLNTADGTATADYRVVTQEYFEVLRTPLREGRWFKEQDGPDAPKVAVVNERFVQIYFPNQDAMDKQIRLENRSSSRVSPIGSIGSDVVQIVGVVGDLKQITQFSPMQDLYNPASPEIFVPFFQHPEAGRDMAILLRTETDPASLAGAVRQQVLDVDHGQPIYDVETLRDMADVVFGPARLTLVLLGIFAGIALTTACVGLYAIVSYMVAQRTNEIGIRMALGAGPREILRVVLREAIVTVGAGLAVGVVASFGLTRLMSTLLYRVPPNDPVTLSAVSALLGMVAFVASYIPARRAMKVDPMVALRHE